MHELDSDQIIRIYRYEDAWTGFACTGNARILLEILKTNGIKGRCYWVEYAHDDGESTGHAYVALDSQSNDDLPLNLPSPGDQEYIPTVGELRHMHDYTDELLALPWSKLR